MLLKQRLALLTTLWFTIMGAVVLVSQLVGFRYERLPAPARVAVNIAYVGLSFLAAEAVRNWLLAPPT